jgi:hypothetical protein
VSNEAAELLQLDAALHMTDRGAFEHRHARSAATNCYNLVCLTPLHALHAAHACVSRIVCVASLRAVLQPNVAVTRDAAQAQGRQLPYISLDAKGASSIHTGAAENDDRERMPSIAFMSHVTIMSCRPHRPPAALRLAAELPSLQDARDWLCTRCHGRKAARLGARRSLQSSACTLLHPCGCGEELA